MLFHSYPQKAQVLFENIICLSERSVDPPIGAQWIAVVFLFHWGPLHTHTIPPIPEEDLLKIALVGKRNDSALYRELARL